MKKLLTIVLAVAAPLVGSAGPYLWFRRQTRRKAAEAQPRIQALLDEMIRIIAEHKGPLDKIVGSNETKIYNDDRRERDLSIHHGGDYYHLDVSVRLEGRKAGCVSVTVYRHRGDAVLRLSWPDFAEYYPAELWLTERLERLDALVGNAGMRRRIDRTLARLGVKDDDDGPPNTN